MSSPLRFAAFRPLPRQGFNVPAFQGFNVQSAVASHFVPKLVSPRCRVSRTRARAFDSKALPTEEHASRVEAVVAGAPHQFQGWARRKLESANYKHLEERVSEIFEGHKAEAQRLFVDVTELPEKIRYTRNHLTHYTGKTDSPKYLKDAEMVQVNWGLRVFIWACLLKEIGISGKAIERLIRRHGDAHFVNL